MRNDYSQQPNEASCLSLIHVGDGASMCALNKIYVTDIDGDQYISASVILQGVEMFSDSDGGLAPVGVEAIAGIILQQPILMRWTSYACYLYTAKEGQLT